MECCRMSANQISVTARGKNVVVTLHGNVRVDAASLLQRSLLEAGGQKNLAINWEQAEHVDACALQVLLAYAKTLKHSECSLHVEKDNPHVRQYLELAGLTDHFPLRQLPTTTEASKEQSA